MRKPRLYSIQSRNARECEQVLSELLALAKAGRISGLNWSAVTDGREILSGRAGVMQRDEGLALLSSFRKASDIANGCPES
ncbi:hypothetical protein GPA27_13570 [Aromatoleum toluolicum]|uniref:Uncharacterized protein n=1 Tax=Aromatoleum toluolicum TaxID=90060 RepID=A0ABX1NGK5_9RHOO|nr:hypothetical protein [Aromatoleum toluolicum]NMF98415.1 hypothetical protein [Aromatoleum toluolicum]